MTKEEILGGNKLIANFMIDDKGVLTLPNCVHSADFEVNSIEDLFYEEEDYEELKYHKSWLWIMPVVDKIESIGSNSVTIGKAVCDIQPIMYDIKKDRMDFKPKIIGMGSTKIVNLWNAIVEYIKIYNKK